MNSNVGLWIDHREAIIVTLTDGFEKIYSIKSEVDKHVRFSGGTPEDQQDKKFTNHLNEYYDKVKAYLADSNPILIFGPGEAKVELSVRLKGTTLSDRIADIETEDKMTEGQIVAKVKKYFANSIKEITKK